MCAKSRSFGGSFGELARADWLYLTAAASARAIKIAFLRCLIRPCSPAKTFFPSQVRCRNRHRSPITVVFFGLLKKSILKVSRISKSSKSGSEVASGAHNERSEHCTTPLHHRCGRRTTGRLAGQGGSHGAGETEAGGGMRSRRLPPQSPGHQDAPVLGTYRQGRRDLRSEEHTSELQ